MHRRYHSACYNLASVEPVLFGKYLLCERLAEGGMAVVYRAKLTGPGGFEKTLVVKQIRAELSARTEFIELFVKEAKTTVQLTHANIVPVYELGMVDGTYFLALELVDGPPLARLVERGALPAPLAAYVVEQILRGLDYAHRREIVHRDLSPSNVLCSRDGEVKILDFGIASEVSGRAVVGGSRGYVAPEQEAGERVDARSDLYAVGVLLWEMLTGKRRTQAAPEGAPQALVEVIERATAARPADRWESAEAMLQPITRFLREIDGSTQADLARFVRRRAPDVAPASAAQPSTSTSTAPRTRPIPREGNATPALGARAFGREVTFATRFVEAEPAAAGQPPSVEAPPVETQSVDAPSVEGPRVDPTPAIAPPKAAGLRSTLWVLGGLLVVGVSAFAGAQLRDAVGTSPPPIVRAAPAPATLAITVYPPGSELTLDGTPLTGAARDPSGAFLVAPGTHTIGASAAAHAPLETEVKLRGGEARSIVMKLPPERGRAELKSEPPGAEVHLGDRSLGVTPLSTELSLDGPARLRFDRRDYAPTERELRPAEYHGGPPRVAQLNVRLEPLPRGQLTLGARPWAHVTIDGERRGDTPLLKTSLSAGAHVVKLACPATSKELRFTVQVEAGKEIRRVADLSGDPRLLDDGASR